MTPEEFNRLMEENRDDKFREFTSKILNTPLEVIGVRMPVMRAAAKRIIKEDWEGFISQPTMSYEHCLVKALVLATAKMPPMERLERTKCFIPEIRDWSVCDTFCGAWKEKGAEDALWDYCVSLLDTGREFPMRVGAVMMMNKFIDDAHIKKMLGLLTKERASTGYYWDMGCAWALSFCYIKYPDMTEEEIFSGRLTLEILRMTVYKVRDSFRVPDDRKKALKERYQAFRTSTA